MNRDYRNCALYRNGTCGICRAPDACPDYSAIVELTDADRDIFENAKYEWRDNRREPDVFKK